MKKDVMSRILNYIEKMDEPKENILEILLIAQNEAGGCILPSLQIELSCILDIPLIELEETIAFFPFFNKVEKVKKIEICMGLSCYMGGNALNESILKNKWKNKFEVIHKECENACEYGPRITIGEKVFQYVSENEMEEIINQV